MKTFRDVMTKLGPSWLVEDGDGAKLLYVVALFIDASLEKMRQSLVARFPEYAETDEAVAYIGRDRQVPRGKNESRERYAARLLAWRYPFGHRVRGNAWSLLEQVRSYFYEAGGCDSATTDRRAQHYVMSAEGSRDKDDFGAVFDYDGDATIFRFLLTVDARNAGVKDDGLRIGDAGLWGGEVDADASGYAVGLPGATQGDVTAIRAAIKQNKPAGTQCQAVLWFVDPAVAYNLYNVYSFAVPDGTWANIDRGSMPEYLRRMSV
jgi:hypothetical protein